MTGIELLVGYLAAWGIRKARRVGKKLDETVDDVTDLALNHLHDVVIAKVGGDSSLQKLDAEAAEKGVVSERTGQRVLLAVEDAAEDDPEFGAQLEAALAELTRLSDNSGTLDGIDLRQAQGVQVGNYNTQHNTFN